MVYLKVNGRTYEVDVDENMPLLWVLREFLKLKGTKYGCGVGECGACTVHVNGEAVRSCVVTVGEVKGASIVTIEGLPEAHPVKRAWIEEQVPQCGYCQPGIIMQVAALMNETHDPDEIIRRMDNVICRCGTYPRIKRAIRKAIELAGRRGA